ncbi:MAG: hypothetical protein ILP10_08285 [Lachnospiraceae bacterium]|nr:hypothetical protein [Lachnospiraceae bacterium]
MPIFLILFLMFCAWFFYERKKADRKTEQRTKAFWEKESEANMTLRKDTSDVPYLKVRFDELPFDPETGSESMRQVQDDLLALRGHSIADLSGMTNTELKLRYGTPNFNMLSEADENYNTLVTGLTRWGELLMNSGRHDDAITVLKAAISYGQRAGTVYQMLAEIYVSRGDSESSKALIADAENIKSLTKEATLATLRDALARSYSLSAPSFANDAEDETV